MSACRDTGGQLLDHHDWHRPARRMGQEPCHPQAPGCCTAGKLRVSMLTVAACAVPVLLCRLHAYKNDESYFHAAVACLLLGFLLQLAVLQAMECVECMCEH